MWVPERDNRENGEGIIKNEYKIFFQRWRKEKKKKDEGKEFPNWKGFPSALQNNGKRSMS